MRNSVYKIDLEMHAAGDQVQLTARRGDTARRIEARIVDHGIPYRQILPTDCRAVMTVKTPEGLTLTNDCDIRADGTVIFDFTIYTVKELGVDECELTLYDGEGGVLTAPRFTILVDDTVFDKGQTIGAAWEEAIERAKEQILETTDALQNKTRGMPLTFGTVAEMQAEDLPEGQITKTRGRWFPNDGGAREYRIVNKTEATINPGFDETGLAIGERFLHPLAIALGNGLYALPILTDQVTFFDIGLKRGRVCGADELNGETVSSYIWRDSSVPAENSRLLQHYLDHIPAMATDPDVCSSTLYKDLTGSGMPQSAIDEYEGRDDIYAKAGMFSRIFVPVGTWVFRDPVVIERPVKIFGCATTTPARRNISDETTRAYPVSALFYPARELTVVAAAGKSVAPFAKAESDKSYAIVEAANRGEQTIDLEDQTVPAPTVYVDHALFYVASTSVTFKDVEFSTSAFSWHRKYELTKRTGDAAKVSGDKNGYRPGDDTHDPNLIGAKYNRITSSRTCRGVNGVICAKPARDQNGRILVYENGKVKMDTSSGGGLEQSKAKWPQFENCQFDGFSGSALVMGSLSRVRNCQFRANYIGITSDGHDCYLDWNYIESGFMAIVTNGHTTYLNNCYLNNMEGFAVVAKFTVVKRIRKSERIYTGEEPESWVTEKIRLSGSLLGKFNADIVACSMGAYGCLSIPQSALIDGRITLCGTLYDLEHTQIARQDDFGALLNFNQAKDAVDGTGRDGAKAWDPVCETWTREPEEGEQTLSEYLTSENGQKYTALYAQWKAAHIRLLAKDAEFLKKRFPADMDAAQQAYAAEQIAELEYDIPEMVLEKLLKWLEDGELPAPMDRPAGEDGVYVIDDFGEENEAAARAAVLAELDDTEVQASNNRSENVSRLIGAAAVTVSISNGLNILAPLLPRQYEAVRYTFSDGGVSKNATRVHLAPLFAVNCMSIYNSNAPLVSQNYRYSFQPDELLFPGVSLEARRRAIRMLPLSVQSYAYANLHSSVTPFRESSTPFYSLKDSAATKDSARYNVFGVRMRQTPTGNVSYYISGTVRTREGVSQGATNTVIPHYENGQPTDRNLQSPLPAQDFGPHYCGFRPVTYTADIIAVETYTEGEGASAVTIKPGDQVGVLLLNFATKNITVRGTANYSGKFADITLGGAM